MASASNALVSTLPQRGKISKRTPALKLTPAPAPVTPAVEPKPRRAVNLNQYARAVGKPKGTPARAGGTPRFSGLGAGATISAARFERLTVIQQVRRSFLPGARLAGVIGLVLGGFVPLATYTVAHYEVHSAPWLWALVLGGLVYSAVSVFTWARAAFGSTSKALGFVVLLEGTLIFGTLTALNLAALLVLVFINAVSAACALQVRKETVTDTRGEMTTLWG